jgi:hypothetical protein
MKSQLTPIGIFSAQGPPGTGIVSVITKAVLFSIENNAVHVADQRAQMLGQKSARVSVEAQRETGPTHFK